MAAPSVSAGAGGKGAKAGPSDQNSQGKGSLSDKVGQMIEDSQQPAEPGEQGQTEGSTVLRERNADELSNPKKRMFEDPPVAPEQEQRARDEL